MGQVENIQSKMAFSNKREREDCARVDSTPGMTGINQNQYYEKMKEKSKELMMELSTS